MARHFIPLFLLLLIPGFLVGCSDENPRPADPGLHGISMQAMADTLVMPDIVVWTVTITDEDAGLPAAKAAVDAKLDAVLAAVAALPVMTGSISKGSANIRQHLERCTDGKTRVSSFRVERKVTFRQQDPEAMDQVLDGLVKAADVEVNCQFEVSGREAIMRRLRLEALARARERASSLVAPTGHVLGELTGINVNEDFDGEREKRSRGRNQELAGPDAKYLSTKVRASYAVR